MNQLLSLSLVGFFAVNPFVRRAERAYAVLDILDKPEGKSLLLSTRFLAHDAINTVLRHLFVFFRNRSRHIYFLSI